MRGKVVCPICKTHELHFSGEADGTSPLEARVEREFAEARLYAHILERHEALTARAPIALKLAYSRNRKKLAAWAETEAEKPAPPAAERAVETAPKRPRSEPKKAAEPVKKRAGRKPKSAAPKPPPGAARGRSGARGKAKGRAK
ncbi:MAG TPA: hypothetical protein VGB99_16725 [Acidobacteriota bacterium]|jgi:uncharacterized Zn finger protein (UPF0148 family)